MDLKEIKPNTILSTTDNKVTLLQWLKSVEKAFKGGTLKSVETKDNGDGMITFVFTMEDGSKVETEPVFVGSALDEYLKHNDETNTTEAGGNFEIDGRATISGKGLAIADLPLESATASKKITCLVFEGLGFDGTTHFYWGIAFDGVVGMNYVYAKDGNAAHTLDDALSGYIGSLNPIVTENNARAMFSQARYQHTLTLRLTETSLDYPTSFVCIQGMSSKNTPIDSYQDLTEVFGGCKLAWTGIMKTGSLGAAYGGWIDLEGGTIGKDSITGIIAGVTVNPVSLSSFKTIVYDDDVCIPK